MKKWISVLLIVTLCFSGLALGFTYGLIQKHKEAQSPDVPIDVPPVAPPVSETRGIDLYGTYDENDLIYTDETVQYKGVEITIPRIAGLKDTAVEDAINAQMQERIYETLDSMPQVNHAYSSLNANFANVIAIQFIATGGEGWERLFFNFDLTTGKELKLTDLFYEDTDILSLVRDGFYKSLSLNLWNDGDLVSPDENLLYKLVKNFMEAENPAFTFYANQVIFYSGDYSAEAEFLDMPTEVAIYERFLTENSIYADDNIGYDNIFTCANSTSFRSFHHLDFGMRGENLWYDVSMMGVWLPEGLTEADKAKLDDFEQSLFDEVYAEIARYESLAKENPDNFYILLAKPAYFVMERSQYVNGVWQHESTNAAGASWNMDIYEMPRSLYESDYRDRLIAAYRYSYFFMAGGAYIDRYQEEVDPAVYTRVATERLINFRTGEEYTLENLFHEGADWLFYVRNEMIRRLTNGWGGTKYTHDKAVELAQKAEISLGGSNIRAKIAEIPDFEVWYNLTEFPDDIIRIYE